ncbi:hypothetical protein CEP52_008584 [Fusarium oligoseptatum]|uniref:Uncharacterized protein n=1 Tax=Fusarium oligoseptatum TaxID=2604345 RepID=A0A428TH71_9HYPO|nr:hypothetical protein CEP52_008584 [Fusarium oligoseptatum]
MDPKDVVVELFEALEPREPYSMIKGDTDDKGAEVTAKGCSLLDDLESEHKGMFNNGAAG